MTRKIKVNYLLTRGLRLQGKRKESIKPKISLTGDWLKNAGFEVGNHIEVIIKHNQLTLKNLSK
jgi:hypothetical protein